ncbi:MAG: hypothetical protein LBR00_01475, partial [Clostridiales Family XIII bacterium]|nr:hypothetical protein [Clostridiales Family XIII bacterium]
MILTAHEIQIAAVLCLLLAALVSFALTPVSRLLAGKLGLIDAPDDDRRMHTEPVPCFGGFAIAAAFT